MDFLHGNDIGGSPGWRAGSRAGRLVLPAPDDPAEFAALIVGPFEDASREGPGAVDRLKLLSWHGTGLAMAYKRPEAATFTWPAIKDG